LSSDTDPFNENFRSIKKSVTKLLQYFLCLSYAYYISWLILTGVYKMRGLTMHIKKLMMTTILSISVLGITGVSANQSTIKEANSIPIKKACKYQGIKSVLTVEQRDELRNIMRNLHVQLTPLIKKKMALKIQLKGKMATPQTQWADINKLVEELNENNAKMTTLITRAQLVAFQKFGVFLPLHHRFHHHGFMKGRGVL